MAQLDQPTNSGPRYESGFRVANPMASPSVSSGKQPQKNHKAIWTQELGPTVAELEGTPVADAGKAIP